MAVIASACRRFHSLSAYKRYSANPHSLIALLADHRASSLDHPTVPLPTLPPPPRAPLSSTRLPWISLFQVLRSFRWLRHKTYQSPIGVSSMLRRDLSVVPRQVSLTSRKSGRCSSRNDQQRPLRSNRWQDKKMVPLQAWSSPKPGSVIHFYQAAATVNRPICSQNRFRNSRSRPRFSASRYLRPAFAKTQQPRGSHKRAKRTSIPARMRPDSVLDQPRSQSVAHLPSQAVYLPALQLSKSHPSNQSQQ